MFFLNLVAAHSDDNLASTCISQHSSIVLTSNGRPFEMRKIKDQTNLLKLLLKTYTMFQPS
jgi:hypothetical protein